MLNKMDTGVYEISVRDEIDFHEFAQKLIAPKKSLMILKKLKMECIWLEAYFILPKTKEKAIAWFSLNLTIG